MNGGDSKSYQGTYPNIITHKKLAPLPLFNQNRSPKFVSHTPKAKSLFGFNSPSAGLLPSSVKASANKTFLNELKTVNNYGRLCDQPFLEFSKYHFDQALGSGGGKKKVVLEPLYKQKEKKKMIQKLYTVDTRAPMNNASAIKIEDMVESPETTNKTSNTKNTENQTMVKKVYQLGNYEALIAFYSLEVRLTSTDGRNSEKLALYLGNSDLKKVFKNSHHEIVSTVLESLYLENDQLKINIKKSKNTKKEQYEGTEKYPEKKENVPVKLGSHNYTVTIYYPYLELSISELKYKEKIMLNPEYLSNLFEEKFNNLEEYIQRFTVPPQVYKTKEEIHDDELKSLPTIIKKVIKTPEFGGLMIFKSMEIHLRNTSDLVPETVMHESTLTPMNQKILRKRKKDVNSVLLRLGLHDLEKTLNCSVQELVDLIKESIVIEEGKGFQIELKRDKILQYKHRHTAEADEFPDVSENFIIRFNKFVYEGYIKFPTLELYIPETNFKDVIQLNPTQLQDLIKYEFENMNDYVKD